MYNKHISKKALSFLLVLTMVLSVFTTFAPQTVTAENDVQLEENVDAKVAAKPQITVSNDKISMTEEREIDVEITFADTPNLEELEWTLGDKTFDQWKKWVNEEKDFVGEPWISFSKEPTIEGNTVKATIKTGLTFDTVNLSGRPYPRTAYPQLIGFYDLKVTDSNTTLTKQLKINAYDNYHTWEEMKPTIDKLIETSESKSDRYFEYRSIGKSTEGRDMHFVIIAKDKDAIDKYLNNTKIESLNNPKDIIEKIDSNKMNDYQVPIFVNNIHPDEAPAVDAQLSLMELFANQDEITFNQKGDTEVTLQVDEVLEDLILVFNLTQNPDGRVYNTRQNIDGFDLNRDNAHQVMKETKNVTKAITEWNPLMFLDLHGFVPEFLIEPCTPPHEPNFEYDLLMGGPRNPETGDVGGKPGSIENARAMGESGIANTKYESYIIPLFDYKDGWDDATTAYTGVYSLIHGALGHTVEIPELNQDSNDAAVYAMLGATNYVLKNKDELYKNQLKINLRGIENEDNRDVDTWHIDKNGEQIGRKRGDNENYFPEYYILPLDESLQKNKLEVYNTIEYLLRNGVKVEKSTEKVVFKDVTYPAGSIVISMRQAKRGLANSILSQGSDESDWDAMYAELVINFPAMKGYDKVDVREKGLFDNKTSQVEELNIPNTDINEIAEKYVIKNNNNDATKAVNKLLSEGKDVDIITGESSDYSKGDFVVSKENMNQIKNDYLLRVSSLEGKVETKKILVPKISSTGLASQTKFVLKELGFDIVEDKDSNIIVDSNGRADKEAVKSGKSYVGIGTAASNFVSTELLPGLEINATGRVNEGLLNGHYSQDSIITKSYGKDDFIYIPGGTVITKVPSTTEVLAEISDKDDFYLEGWWPGNEAAKGQIFGINDKSNDRNVTLFTGDVTNKAQPQYLYRLLSNSIYSALLEEKDIELERLAGENRELTAVEVSKKMYDKADNVILANGYVFPDALASSSLAKTLNAPILLTHNNKLNADTLAEIKRLGAKTVYVSGGVEVISRDLVRELNSEGLRVIRVAGDRRESTAVEIGKLVVGRKATDTAIVVNGYDFPDALSVGAAAAAKGYPILFVNTNQLTDTTKDALANWNIKNVKIIGGEKVVSKAIKTELETKYSVERIAGENRETTAIEVAKKFFPDSKQALIANGYNFPDGLVGGPLAAELNAPVLLANTDKMRDEVKTYLEDTKDDAVILGGFTVISKDLEKQIYEAVNKK